MSHRATRVGGLTEEQVRSALNTVAVAPSLYASQSWRFRCTAQTIELHADCHRRDVLLACGAALLTLRVAIRGLGVHPAVQLLPDANQPDLLAVVRPEGPTQVTLVDQQLTAAMSRSHNETQPDTPVTVPVTVLNQLRQAARTEQAWMATITPTQLPVLRELVGQDFDPGALVAVVGSFRDLPLTQLHAGQAVQRVLLTAANAGLSVSLLPAAREMLAARKQLRELMGGGLWPQTVLRLGYGPHDIKDSGHDEARLAWL
jgi:hypothetical protein